MASDNERRHRRARRLKKIVIREAKLLAQSDDWGVAGKEMASLHKRWKAAGSAGREYDDKLWTEFRALTEKFYERRRVQMAERHRLAKRRAQTKQHLIVQAESLSALSDFTQANGQFKDLMVRWRDTGHAGTLESGLWERFVAARQAMYDATAQDRRMLQSEYVQRVAERIQHHRDVLSKARSLCRDLELRRRQVVPGWVGMDMAEELDDRIADIKDSIVAREGWLEQDLERLNQAQSSLST